MLTAIKYDFAAANWFLNLLDANAATFTFQTFDDNKDRKDRALAQIFNGTIESHGRELAALNERGAGVFITVNETDGKGRTLENILRSRAVWQEDDDGWDGDLPLVPSLEVESSPGKFHRYWLCDDLSKDDFAAIMARIVLSFGGDKSAKDLARVLRLPGFVHRKGDPFLVRIISDTGEIYPREALIKAFPAIPKEKPTPRRSTPKIENGIDVERVRRALSYIPATEYHNWYQIGAALQHDLGETGRQLWDEWSGSCNAKFTLKDQHRKWRDVARIEKLTLGTVIHRAKKGGFKEERRARIEAKIANGAATNGAHSPQTGAETVADWEWSPDGKLLKNEHNIVLALTLSDIKLSYDEFAYRYLINGLPGYGPTLLDEGLDEIYLHLQRGGMDRPPFKPAKQDCDRAVLAEARRNRFHPVRDYLNAVEWDGVERIDEWLLTYFGVENDQHGVARAIGRVVLIGAVRRIRRPGCKFDYMLVLEGPQNAGKSSGARTLAPDEDWFTDNVTVDLKPKEFMETSAGKWIIEIPELSGMKRGEVEKVKAMITRQTESARMAYDRLRKDHPRQSVFIGTTNETNYLLDETGNRRFLPVRVGTIDIKALKRDRDQLWAEAAHFEAKGETLIIPEGIRGALAATQSEREVVDAWDQIVADWLDEKFPGSGDLLEKSRTTLAHVAAEALKIDYSRLDSAVQKRISRAMKRAGWTMALRSNGKRYWKRGENDKIEHEEHSNGHFLTH